MHCMDDDSTAPSHTQRACMLAQRHAHAFAMRLRAQRCLVANCCGGRGGADGRVAWGGLQGATLAAEQKADELAADLARVRAELEAEVEAEVEAELRAELHSAVTQLEGGGLLEALPEGVGGGWEEEDDGDGWEDEGVMHFNTESPPDPRANGPESYDGALESSPDPRLSLPFVSAVRRGMMARLLAGGAADDDDSGYGNDPGGGEWATLERGAAGPDAFGALMAGGGGGGGGGDQMTDGQLLEKLMAVVRAAPGICQPPRAALHEPTDPRPPVAVAAPHRICAFRIGRLLRGGCRRPGGLGWPSRLPQTHSRRARVGSTGGRAGAAPRTRT